MRLLLKFLLPPLLALSIFVQPQLYAQTEEIEALVTDNLHLIEESMGVPRNIASDVPIYRADAEPIAWESLLTTATEYSSDHQSGASFRTLYYKIFSNRIRDYARWKRRQRKLFLRDTNETQWLDFQPGPTNRLSIDREVFKEFLDVAYEEIPHLDYIIDFEMFDRNLEELAHSKGVLNPSTLKSRMRRCRARLSELVEGLGLTYENFLE